jgi:hypothetical protein
MLRWTVPKDGMYSCPKSSTIFRTGTAMVSGAGLVRTNGFEQPESPYCKEGKHNAGCGRFRTSYHVASVTTLTISRFLHSGSCALTYDAGT